MKSSLERHLNRGKAYFDSHGHLALLFLDHSENNYNGKVLWQSKEAHRITVTKQTERAKQELKTELLTEKHAPKDFSASIRFTF